MVENARLQVPTLLIFKIWLGLGLGWWSGAQISGAQNTFLYQIFVEQLFKTAPKI
jgi:hypothetical protein